MNKSSMDMIYREYKNDVYRYLYYLCRNHHNAEDLMQETFYRACSRLDNLEGGRTKAWLLRVAHNAYIDRLRKESRSSVYENEFFHNVPSEETPEASVLTGESRQELHAMLSMLPPNQQHAVLLYDIHGFSYQESADLMGIPLSHFKIILYRARQKLRKGRETA
ncbi:MULTISPECIES: RNA polymerase sigma factor [Paenibacillus]|uniref:ECF RNA polymerase sigma factor SigM n=1 Tax=Paenibacillus vini TaxID=1476024 RepID=A0ABQ4M9S5_9BACL|nr:MULTISPECIES: sigma-70 family RNA polymerase sigma factor [Paenibacillus]MBQ4900911.1 sigma-70 family RNA polymerase sigma factor [Paenibacillus sp. Marseille-P2973]GIP52392.1 ECF RNA polymerase sigma factor SigM [Paenibacillus vini]